MITREELENLRRLAGEGDLRSQYKLDEMIPKVIDTALSLLDETDELKGKNELLIQTVEFQGKMFTKLEKELVKREHFCDQARGERGMYEKGYREAKADLTALRKRVEELETGIKATPEMYRDGPQPPEER